METVLSAESLIDTALKLLAQGQAAQAEALVRPALGDPRIAGHAMDVMGLAHAARGKHRIAEAWFEQATQLQPDNPIVWRNLAAAREHQGLVAEASDARVAAAVLHHRRRELEPALSLLRSVLARDPGCEAAYVDIAAVLDEIGQPADALRFGVALLKGLAKQQPGVDAFVAQLPPDLRDVPAASVPPERLMPGALRTAQVLNNIGNAALHAASLDLAERAYRLSNELAPGEALVRWNLALMLLSRGDFENGWALYESRWQRPDWEFPRRDLPRPEWNGQPVAGKTLLVYCEQGFGDSLQFLRLLKPLLAKGARVIFEVQPELLWLARQSLEAPGLMVIPRMDDPRQVYGSPTYDFHTSVMSLPARLNLQLEQLPVSTRYLRADDAALQRWAERLGAKANMRVGIVWAGRPEHRSDAQRSLPLAALAPLWKLPGVDWHSLQLGRGLAELEKNPVPALKHWTADLTSFAETAALIAQLDLVVCVDTAVAHLAGALGKPTWILLAKPAEWRWLREREDSPWYPSVRLFRQHEKGEWGAVVARVAAEISDLVSNRKK